MIHLFCCIGVDEDITNLNLVVHFLDFYRGHGVDDFYIILQSNSGDEQRIAAANEILNSFNIDAKETWTGEYRSPTLHKHMMNALKTFDRNDWIIPADVDEFHHFPKQARKFLKECEEQGYNCVRARLVDRIAADGTMKAIEKEIPLEEQFPLALEITGQMLGGNIEKIAAFKQPLVPGMGHHAIVKRKRKAVYAPYTLETHHYKWDSLVQGRLQRRFRTYSKEKIRWAGESGTAVNHLQEHDGVVPLYFNID